MLFLVVRYTYFMKNRETIAYVLTRILDPVVFLVILIGLFCVRFGVLLNKIFPFVGIILGAIALPALAVYVYFRKIHWVVDWDVSNRNQRIRLFIVLLALFLPGLIFLGKIGNPSIELLSWVLYGWFVGHAGITLFWKQSGHTGIATFVLGILYEWFGGVVIPFFLLVPILAWTRIVLHKHTPAQTLGGIVYSILILMLLRMNGIWY